jgi:hypothetical protein
VTPHWPDEQPATQRFAISSNDDQTIPLSQRELFIGAANVLLDSDGGRQYVRLYAHAQRREEGALIAQRAVGNGALLRWMLLSAANNHSPETQRSLNDLSQREHSPVSSWAATFRIVLCPMMQAVLAQAALLTTDRLREVDEWSAAIRHGELTMQVERGLRIIDRVLTDAPGLVQLLGTETRTLPINELVTMEPTGSTTQHRAVIRLDRASDELLINPWAGQAVTDYVEAIAAKSKDGSQIVVTQLCKTDALLVQDVLNTAAYKPSPIDNLICDGIMRTRLSDASAMGEGVAEVSFIAEAILAAAAYKISSDQTLTSRIEKVGTIGDELVDRMRLGIGLATDLAPIPSRHPHPATLAQ